MTRMLLRIAVLTGVYLLCLTSVRLGDILTGLVLSTLLAALGRKARPLGPPPDIALSRRLAGLPVLIAGTLMDMAGATWHTARWLLSKRRSPGLVDIPIPACGEPSAAAWGIRVGLSPDTVVVEIDDEGGRMLLHVIDASDPAAVVAAQLEAYERVQRRVFP
jgi:multisubunit Na+/H+ antiporter MnhE subunit